MAVILTHLKATLILTDTMNWSLNMSRRHRRRRAGFTLMEMLIVMALIALLAGVMIANFDKIFGGGQEKTAVLFVKTTAQIPLTAYKVDMGNYPTSAQGLQALVTSPEGSGSRWKGPYTKEGQIPMDPWGNPYQYRFPGTKNPASYDLYSFGPDGVESGDDIGNW